MRNQTNSQGGQAAPKIENPAILLEKFRNASKMEKKAMLADAVEVANIPESTWEFMCSFFLGSSTVTSTISLFGVVSASFYMADYMPVGGWAYYAFYIACALFSVGACYYIDWYGVKVYFKKFITNVTILYMMRVLTGRALVETAFVGMVGIFAMFVTIFLSFNGTDNVKYTVTTAPPVTKTSQFASVRKEHNEQLEAAIKPLNDQLAQLDKYRSSQLVVILGKDNAKLYEKGNEWIIKEYAAKLPGQPVEKLQKEISTKRAALEKEIAEIRSARTRQLQDDEAIISESVKSPNTQIQNKNSSITALLLMFGSIACVIGVILVGRTGIQEAFVIVDNIISNFFKKGSVPK